MKIIHGVIHGRTIELQEEAGLADGETVAVTIERLRPTATKEPKQIPAVESWKDTLVFDPTTPANERVVKGTNLSAEALVTELEQGKSDREMLEAHSELCQSDIDAVRRYAQAPEGLRRSFGAWAQDAEELDKYLEWTRQQRKIKRRSLEDPF